MNRLNGHLEGIYTLLAPMSHIGESHGIDSYLATQDIIGPEGDPVEIFTYSGNAIRGMLRDCGAKYFLDKLSDNIMQIPLPLFYFLFSGGTIGGDQKIDIDQARNIRKSIPIASIFGGGVGNQILAGKMCVNDAYPVCQEAMHFIPGRYLKDGKLLSWRQMTTERSYTRMDDAKDERKRHYISDGVKALDGQLFDDKKPKKEKDEPAVQMRYTVEVMQAGTRLYHRLDVRDLSEIEMGALVSALHEWTKSPYLGGKSNIGMGRATVNYTWKPFEEAEQPFLETHGDELTLGKTAEQTKQVYDAYLADYNAYLSSNKESLVKMLE